ncbi:hypothetical protein [Pelagibacterium sp.]|uniref:hypothetical protein n=1 Tax=Pelagibacterium sp. TaxID=1967288 RepID=UPI003A919792
MEGRNATTAQWILAIRDILAAEALKRQYRDVLRAHPECSGSLALAIAPATLGVVGELYAEETGYDINELEAIEKERKARKRHPRSRERGHRA